MPVRLVLPYPPALNSLYQPVLTVTRKMLAQIQAKIRVRGVAFMPARMLKTKDHRAYVDACEASMALSAAFIGADMPLFPTEPLLVDFITYRPRANATSVAAGDIDRGFKAAFDGCNGKIWADDSQIVKVSNVKQLDRANPRLELVVTIAGEGEGWS